MTTLRIGLIVFDLDGTLVDTRHDIAACLNEALLLHDLPTHAVAAITRHVGHGAHAMVAGVTGVPPTSARCADITACFLARYARNPLRYATPMPGVPDILASLDVPLAVCTNKTAPLAEAVLAGLGLRASFGQVVACGDDERKKPDPAPLRALARREGVAPGECVMVGDGPQDVLCALGAGAIAVGLASGFHGVDTLRTAGATHLIETLWSLPSLLRSLDRSAARRAR